MKMAGEHHTITDPLLREDVLDFQIKALQDQLDEQKQMTATFNALAVGHALDKHRLQDGNERLAPWMAAALDDPSVCSEMKADIQAWLDAAADKAATDNLAPLKAMIDSRLNDYLCNMKPFYDDSITGFNEAWDIIRKVFAEVAQ
jgi:hypothetical protein